MRMSDTAETVIEQDPPKKPRKKRTAKSYAVSFLLKTAMTALVLWVLLYIVGGVFVCHDNSSYPMIKDGDLCITYRLGALKQGDVIVYRINGENRFGRIIAAEGESVDIVSDYVTVNGYGVFEDTLYPTKSEGAGITFPYTVSENCVFVLNDHRIDISDSRTYGGVRLDDVQGKVIFIMRKRGI